jgi:hypothetical protein
VHVQIAPHLTVDVHASPEQHQLARAEEVAAAPVVATDLDRAVDIVLGWRRG